MPVITPHSEQKSAPVSGSLSQAIEAQASVGQEPQASASQENRDEALSPKYVALARKEKELRRMQQAIQAEKEAFKAQESEYKSSYIPKARLKNELLQVLHEEGFSQDDVANLLLQQSEPQSPAFNQMQKKILELEAKLSEPMEKIKEQETRQYEQALSQIRNETKILIDSDPQFETVKEMGATEAVVELIRQTFDSEGVLLSVEEASKQVEEHLIEQAMRMANLGKVRAKLSPSPENAQGKDHALSSQTKPQITQQIKTLTNQATATSSRPLSVKERRERAVLAFKGQLNS